MKKITLLTFILFSVLSYAQVGINTNTPDASSALDIESNTGGILIPRLTETQRDAISSPATGLMIYQTDQDFGFYFYNGTGWTSVGISGPQGPQGETGATGPAGPQGPQGAPGIEGPIGPQGDQGLQGIQGPAGADGTNGTNGSSAYEIWIAAGNTGTEAEFLASLVGVQGEPGAQGPQGIQGETGATGSTGPEGPQGPQGIQGVTGAQGPIGATGPAGQDGQDGADGDSYTQPTYLNNTFYAELGGYVIQISPNGKHGLVVAMQDQGTSTWYEASDILSNASNHDADGKEFSDWRLPTKRELLLVYDQEASIGGFNTSSNSTESTYWSSSPSSTVTSYVVWFRDRYQSAGQYTSLANVRAVRAF